MKQPSGNSNRKTAKKRDARIKELEDQLKQQSNRSTINGLDQWTDLIRKGQYADASVPGFPESASNPEDIDAAIELPIYPTPPPKFVKPVEGMLAQLEFGQFRLAADFCDSILRDDRVSAVMDVRINSLTGSKITLLPADNSEQARLIQEDCEEMLSHMAPLIQQGEMLRWGRMLGFSLSQILWDTDTDGKWTPCIKIWHPRNTYFNWGIRQYMVITEDQGQKPVMPADPEWLLFLPSGFDRPYLRSLIRPLSYLFLRRQSILAQWSRAAERNGMPMLKVTAPANAEPQTEKLILSQLKHIGSSPIVRVPQGVEGNKWDVKWESANSDLYLVFKELLDHTDRSIAILVLGQDKTTQGNSGGINIGGESAGENVKLGIIKSDAEAMAEQLRDKLLKRYVEYNYGADSVDLTPYIEYGVEPPADLLEEAKKVMVLSKAIEQLAATHVGQYVDYKALAEEFELPLLEQYKGPLEIPNVEAWAKETADDAAVAAQKPAPAAGGPGASDSGDSSGDPIPE